MAESRRCVAWRWDLSAPAVLRLVLEGVLGFEREGMVGVGIPGGRGGLMMARGGGWRVGWARRRW